MKNSSAGQAPLQNFSPRGVHAAAAAGPATGFSDIFAAVDAMHCRDFIQYTPDPAAGAVYDALYREYKALSDYFGRGGNDVMERLKI